MFQSVEAFYKEFITTNPRFPQQREHRLMLIAIAMMKEANEVHELLNWKWWKQPKDFDREHFIEENVDVIHFLIEGLIEAEVTPQEFFEKFVEKAQVNRRRQLSNY